MSAMIDDKIHPFLTKSFANKRRRLIAQQAEAALRFELADEHIEEREYDEQAHLRVHRIINRKVFRGEACERYATFVAGLQESDGEADLESQVRSQMDLDLCSIASDENLQKDVLKAVRSYADVIPSEKWPAVLCMTRDLGDVERLRRQVESLNFPILSAGLLERFGIVKFASPPEAGFIRRIAGLAETCSIADAGTPVAAPTPMRVSPMMAEARRIIGLTREIAEGYGQDVVVAILDSGLDFGHAAFRGFSRGDYRNFTSGDDADLDGHGTHVASIAIGGDASRNGIYGGVAPRARLVFGKVISGNGGETSSRC